MSRSTNLRTNSSNKLPAVERLQQQTMNGWKTREIGVRQGANHSQVRPRTAEQGPAQRSRGPFGDATVKLAVSALMLAPRASLGSDPRNKFRGPSSALRCARLRGCDPAAGSKRIRWIALFCTPTRSHPPRGPCSTLRCAHLARIRNAAWRRLSSGFQPQISGSRYYS